ncbi:MAG: DUF922 domain-containing protein [Candidatus Saccharimonadales bacterium]
MSLVYQSTVLEGAKIFVPAMQLAVATRFLKRMVVLLVCSAVLCVATFKLTTMLEATRLVSADTPSVTQKSALSLPPAPVPTTPAVAPVVTTTATCTPYGPATAPSALSMTTSGLQQLVDTPSTYTIHGTSSREIQNQLRRCAPTSSDGTFSGTTMYWLGAQYGYSITPTANCKLTDITVAVHVSQVLPRWQDSASPTLSNQWASYERSLVLHENGHTIIDISHAQTLLDELTAMPEMPCDTIANAANAITNARLSALDRANDEYDAATNHGATQGAIW